MDVKVSKIVTKFQWGHSLQVELYVAPSLAKFLPCCSQKLSTRRMPPLPTVCSQHGGTTSFVGHISWTALMQLWHCTVECRTSSKPTDSW